jgi:large subunit ribosomal protein L28
MIMAYRCSICGKGAQAAHNVSHSNRKSRKWQKPNLQSVRVSVQGRAAKVRVCTRCIRSGKVQKAA